MKPTAKKVTYEQLRDRMVIEAYSGFSVRYQHMEEKTVRWLQHNFRGASVIVRREGKQLECMMEEMQIDDTLFRIHKFPDTLKKLTIVSQRLVQELRGRGFTGFEVLVTPKTETRKQMTRKEAVQSANELVQKVKESVQVRSQAKEAVEDMMDNARNNKINQNTIKASVESITQNASADAIAAMVSLKESDQTYAHCVDVGAIFETAYFEIIKRNGGKSVFVDRREAMMASFLHDFGKSQIPKEILDSTKRFDRDGPEMKMMLSHPTMSADLLSKMGMPDYIVNMSHYHHVKVSTSMKSSYPQIQDYSIVLPETRLLAIIDVYQALVGKRSYKKSWSPPAAIRYLDALVGVEFDVKAWEDFINVTGKYPKSSLVELNDGSLGFVMNVPFEDLDHPQVVVVRNKDGQDMKNGVLIDLETERDVSIVKDLDAQDVFGNNALDVFMNINAT